MFVNLQLRIAVFKSFITNKEIKVEEFKIFLLFYSVVQFSLLH